MICPFSKGLPAPGPVAPQLHFAAPEFEHLHPWCDWRAGLESRISTSPLGDLWEMLATSLGFFGKKNSVDESIPVFWR